MLIALALLGGAAFCTTLWATLTVARLRDLPLWRRYLPLLSFLLAATASLLRGLGIPEPADVVAFPLNLAALVLSLRTIRARRAADRARAATDSASGHLPVPRTAR